MCGRMYIEPHDPTGELAQILATLRYKDENEYNSIKFSGEIFPSNVIPVLLKPINHEPIAVPMKWGFPRFDGKGLIINARSETASIKPTFKSCTKSTRCIIPISNYFEWKTEDNKKIKYAFQPLDNTLTYIAGLYKKDVQTDTYMFTVLTRQANETLSFIHDRMPVILTKNMISPWLSTQQSFESFLIHSRDDISFKLA